jgi:hypothetical protein
LDGYINHLHNTSTIDLKDSLKWINSFTDKFAIIKNNLEGVNRDIALLMLSAEFSIFLSNLDKDFYDQAKVVSEYFNNHKYSEKYFDLFIAEYNGFLKIAHGTPAPDFTLLDSTGKQVSLSDFKGKVGYINFWGTWCGPCIESIPNHLELQQEFKNRKDIVYMYVGLEYGEKDILYF